MKKKIIVIALVVAILAIAAFGTLAYYTDTDSKKNVMVIGSVDIDQIEQERDASGALVDFKQNKQLRPAIFETAQAGYLQYDDPNNYPVANDQAWKVVTPEPNVIDKFITVENTGKSNAYIRTLIAYEGDATYGPEGAYIHVVHNTQNITCKLIGKGIVINNVPYTVYEYTYEEVLEPEKTSTPSLKQVYMNQNATNEVAAYYGEEYSILALTQAVQSDGFDTAKAGLDRAFGESTAASVAEWLADVA